MEKIKAERDRNMGRKCAIKVKVTHVQMIKFVEEAARNFNVMQSDGTGRRESVRSMFKKLGQSPWFTGSGDSFVEHLNKLKEDTHYKRDAENNVQNQ